MNILVDGGCSFSKGKEKMKLFQPAIILTLLPMLAICGCNNTSVASPVEDTFTMEWVDVNNGEGLGRYFLKNNQIYVHVNAMISEPLKNADPTSFQVSRVSSEYGRDNKHVWYISNELRVDPRTWRIISRGYSKDRYKVYWGPRELPGADPTTFKIVRDGIAEWGADENSVYCQWTKLEEADPQTFQFIDYSFSKDKNGVYYDHYRLDGADPKSFEIIGINVGKDKNAIFAFGRKMPSFVDLLSVRAPGDGYIYDRNGRYFLRSGKWAKDEN